MQPARHVCTHPRLPSPWAGGPPWMPGICLALLYVPVWICDYEFLLYSQNCISECICQKDKEPKGTTHEHKWENWTAGHFYRKWDQMAWAVILAVVLRPTEAHLERDCGPLWLWDSDSIIARENLLTSAKDLLEQGRQTQQQVHSPTWAFWWAWRELLLGPDIYKGKLIICPGSSTCSHVNQQDHWCSKHAKGGAPNVTDYGEPQADGMRENQQEETTLLGYYSVIHLTISSKPLQCVTAVG